jgi:hypothetical protein
LSAVSDALVSGIVAGAVSLVVTFGKIVWDGRQKTQERRLAAREKLDRDREPLLTAADALGSRINNIRRDGFLSYLDVPERQRTAMLGTLFRFAQLFGWTEILYGTFDRLRFEQDASTKAVADALRDIGRLLAVDRVDRTDPVDPTTTRLMIWREEQRAIGELMRVDSDPPRCLSFDSFARQYDERFSPWFAAFAAQLDPVSTPPSERLAELQRLLAGLVRELDVDLMVLRTDVGGELIEPRWARPSMLAATARSRPVERGPAS